MASDPSLLRALIDRGSEEIELDELRSALAAAGDEDDLWEAKGGQLRPEHIHRAVAGLANRSGGLLVLGASRIEDIWQLDGTTVTGEPGLWIDQVIRSGLQPAPPHRIRTYDLGGGRIAAIVRVERHPEHLAATHDGKILRREHGSTEPVADGAELTRMVQERAAPASAVINPDLSPDELAKAATTAALDGRAQALRPTISGLQARIVRAAEFEPVGVLDLEVDKLSSLAGSLAAVVPGSDVARLALGAHHRAFDAGVGLKPTPTVLPDLDLFRPLLRNTRALGALLVRLELWEELRALAVHRASGNDDVYPGWISYIKVRETRTRMRAPNAKVLRWPLREAKDTGLRVPALHPDGADEHQVLDSILNFEFLAALIELEQCAQRELAPEVSVDFVAFASDPQRSIVSRLASEESMRAALLPNCSAAQSALLLLNLEQLARRQSSGIGERWGGSADPLTMAQLHQAIAA
jgi:hypothetical protein